MDGLLKELHGLIERKISLYNKFILLLQDQWDCITEYSLDSLQGILDSKEDLVAEMQFLEKERGRLMQKIERHLGTTGITLKKLIERTKDPVRTKLAEGRETLLAQIITINELHERIKGLMDRSSLSIKKSLVFVHSMNEAAASPYHANGKVGQGRLQGRMLSLDA